MARRLTMAALVILIAACNNARPVSKNSRFLQGGCFITGDEKRISRVVSEWDRQGMPRLFIKIELRDELYDDRQDYEQTKRACPDLIVKPGGVLICKRGREWRIAHGMLHTLQELEGMEYDQAHIDKRWSKLDLVVNDLMIVGF